MTLRCANCGHLRSDHEHYRRGLDCAYPRCLCMRWGHPVLGWIYHHWDRLADWWGRR